MSDPATSPTPTTSDAERALIGSIIYTRGAVLDHLEFDPTDYQEPRFEDIHRIAQGLRADGAPVDPVTLDERIQTRTGGRSFAAELHRLAEQPSSPAGAEHYAKIVTDQAARRRVAEMAAKARSMAVEGANPDTIIAEAHQMLEALKTRARTTEQVQFIGETLPDTIEALAEPPKYTPTPWPELDDQIGGFRPGALYVAGARPGIGKSLFALEAAINLAGHGSVAFISPEMPEREVHQRALANRGRLEITRLINHQIDTDHEWERLASAAGKLEHLPIAVREGAVTVPQIRRYAAAVHARRPLAGIIIDYLQMIRAPDGDRRNRHEQVAEASWALKDLAMRLDVPVIALAQLNRTAVSEDRPPQVHHLKDSGSVEQDADVVMLLHRPPEQQWELQVGIGKNRHGPTGGVTLDFRGYQSRITSPSQRGT